MRARQADGVIWVIHEIEVNRDWVDGIEAGNLPPIIFLHMHPDPDLNVVTINNKAGTKLAVSHLIEQSCRKVDIITEPSDWWESRARLAGWRAALEQVGLETESS